MRSAEQGNVGAQIRLGIECMVGANVPKDPVKAEEWLKKGVQGPIGVQGLIREEWLMEGVRGLVGEQRSIEYIPSSAMYFFLFHTETHVFFLLSSSQFFLRFHFLRSLPSAFSCVEDA